MIFDDLKTNENRLIYALRYNKPPMVQLTFGEMEKYNENKHGIFATVNEFLNGLRRMTNLHAINAWIVDMDHGTKEEQLERIKKSPLIPSTIIETKRGHQCYWNAREATVEAHPHIQRGLVELFNADKNAKDLSRILRVPGFYHWKDENDPYLIDVIHDSDMSFDEGWMLKYFSPNAECKKTNQWTPKGDNPNDVEKALVTLSGHPAVNKDRFTLRENGNGTRQIWVNGKTTACWIDSSGWIGSHDKGGPSIVQWLNWYSNDYRGALNMLRDRGIWNDYA